MHHRTTAVRSIDEGYILLNAVIGLHLETPPVCPQRAANIVFSQLVCNLVSLDAVVECANLVIKLLGEIQNRQHLVRAVTMHVNDDLAIKHARKRLKFKITLRLFRVLLLVC